MIIKIFLVAILIILSWNTIKVSESNAFLRAQITDLKEHSEQVTKDILTNNELLVKQGKSIDKNSNLSDLNKSLLLKVTEIEGSLKGLSNANKSLDKINKTLSKQTKTAEAIKKSTDKIIAIKKTTDGLVSIKKPIYQIIEMLKKQSASIKKHTDALGSLKKPIYEIIEMSKKQSTSIKKHSDGLAALKKPIYEHIEMSKKQAASIKKLSDGLNALKKPVYQIIDMLKKHTNGLGALKSPIYQIIEMLKKQPVSMNKPTNGYGYLQQPVFQIIDILKQQPTSLNNAKDTIYALNVSDANYTTVNKPVSKKISIPEPKTARSLNRVYEMFYDTKEQYRVKNYKGAIDRLTKLKSEVLGVMDLNVVPEVNVKPIISAIELTKKKWEGGETDYNLCNIANLINILAPNTNTIGTCK